MLTLTAMWLNVTVYVIVFISLLIWTVRKKWFSWKVFGSGVLIFIVFVLILEPIVHRLMIVPPVGESSFPHLKFSNSPIMFALYGALMAGIFEESGRMLAFLWLIPKRRSYGDGFVYGVGHGGTELLIIGFLGTLSSILLLITFNQTGNEPIFQNLPPEQLNILKKMVETIESTPFVVLLVGLVERIIALVIQIALSLFVLLGLLQKRYLVYPAAIVLHAIVDFMPGLYQAGMIRNIWLVEGVLMVFGAVALIFIVRSKRLFDKSISHLVP